MLPCSSVLLQKIKRSNLVTAMWKNAITSDSYTWCPEENGWVLAESRYAIKWFDGLQVPRDVCNNIDAGEDVEEEETEDYEYHSSSDESDIDLD